jgi:hypothetical protein
MEGESEVFFQCPYCFSSISMVFEIFYGEQQYIEDCEVCCQPISVSYSVHDNQVTNLQIERAQ